MRKRETALCSKFSQFPSLSRLASALCHMCIHDVCNSRHRRRVSVIGMKPAELSENRRELCSFVLFSLLSHSNLPQFAPRSFSISLRPHYYLPRSRIPPLHQPRCHQPTNHSDPQPHLQRLQTPPTQLKSQKINQPTSVITRYPPVRVLDDPKLKAVQLTEMKERRREYTRRRRTKGKGKNERKRKIGSIVAFASISQKIRS